MPKKPVSARVDSDLWNAFLRFVSVKRGKLWGAVGDELSRAIAHYMTSDPLRTNAHELAQTSPLKHNRRSVDTAERIGAKLDEMYPDHKKLDRKQICQAIGAVVSPDPRHYRKYIPMLESSGVIRHWKFGVYELPRRGIKEDVHEILEAHRKAEVLK